MRTNEKKKSTKPKGIEFACRNCLNMFTFAFTDVYLDKVRELHFTPEPECPRCGSTEDLVFSNYGQEQIDDMIFSNKILVKK